MSARRRGSSSGDPGWTERLLYRPALAVVLALLCLAGAGWAFSLVHISFLETRAIASARPCNTAGAVPESCLFTEPTTVHLHKARKAVFKDWCVAARGGGRACVSTTAYEALSHSVSNGDPVTAIWWNDTLVQLELPDGSRFRTLDSGPLRWLGPLGLGGIFLVVSWSLLAWTRRQRSVGVRWFGRTGTPGATPRPYSRVLRATQLVTAGVAVGAMISVLVVSSTAAVLAGTSLGAAAGGWLARLVWTRDRSGQVS